ncbi:kelch domain-containing protein 4-like [Ornithodoros turicata]|uniref:kelch domain-containing protein 4-like n=1 Tax=Ornithodoros turicata TaxID=34597 RepID=UPI0031393629
MGKKDKKKGKGAEKTVAKTEKKAAAKLKKELAAKGEDDIEKLISEFVEADRQRQTVTEELVEPPSFRSGLSLCVHPEKDQLLLFGGEYFNGNKTVMYNELYFYNIKKNNWLLVKTPNLPPPRCAHQAVVVPQGGGQMWVFGGEFASPTRSQFYHYKDLWVFSLTAKRWEQVNAPGGPSARSGHRMVQLGRQLLVFGGFHESARDYRYFNDLYLFSLDERKWTKLEPVNSGPCPRSGCQLACTTDGKVVVYGGYSRERLKKDVDRGVAHTDMYVLQADARSGTVPKWKWIQIKQSGSRPGPRSGLGLTPCPPNRAYLFGGVQDTEDEEELEGCFFNDLYLLELDKGHWRKIELRGEATAEEKNRGKKQDKANILEGEEGEGEKGEAAEEIERLSIQESSVVTSDDGVFTVTIGGANEAASADHTMQEATTSRMAKDVLVPVARMNAAMAMKHNVLYLYGGMVEDGDKQFTLSDMYSLDLTKLDTWKVLIPLDSKAQEWLGSDSESEEEEEDMELDEESESESED